MKRRGISTLSVALIPFGLFLLATTTRGQGSSRDTLQVEEEVKKGWNYYLEDKYDSSTIEYQKASTIFLESRSWEPYAHCLNLIADCLSRKLRFDSSEAVLMEALRCEETRLNPENLEYALTLSLLGLLRVNQDKFDDAISCFVRGKDIRNSRLGKNDRSVASSYYLLATAYYGKGNYERAMASGLEALRIYSMVCDKDHFDLAITLVLIGMVCNARSEPDLAREYYVRARLAIEGDERRSPAIEAYCEFALGWSCQESGDFVSAADHLRRGININTKVFGEGHVSNAPLYFKLGELYEARGDYDRAIQFYQEARTLHEKYLGRTHSSVGIVTRRLGAVYANKKELENALYFADRSLWIQLKALGENHPELSFTHETLGRIYEKRGELSKALDQYQRALDLRSPLSGTDERNDVARLYAELGSVHAAMRDYESALNYYHKSLSLHKHPSVPSRLGRGTTLKGIGDVYFRKKAFERALRYYQDALISLAPGFSDTSIYSNPTPDAAPASDELVRLFRAKAAAFESMRGSRPNAIKNLQAASSAYDCAANIVARLRKKLTLEGSKLSLGEESYSLYQNAIRLSMRLFGMTLDKHQKERAFYFAEQSKANVLLDGLADAEAKQFAGIPDSIVSRERSLRIDLAHAETKLEKEIDKKEKQDSVKMAGLQSTCFKLNNELEELLTSLEKRYPRYFSLKYRNNAPTIPEIQNALDEETCIVEYAVGEREITVFTISKGSFEAKRLRKPIGFEETAASFFRAIKTVDKDVFLRTGCLLCSWLVLPLKRELENKKRVVIIPDGILYYVPFEALIVRPPTKRENLTDFTRLDYLVKTYEISYSYSSAFYLNRLRQNDGSRRSEESFAGFAPVFRDSNSSGLRLSCTTTRIESDSTELRSATLDGKRFSELKYSEGEITSVAENFRSSGKTATSFLNDEASEENFKARIGTYSCVHIATHGYFNEEHPQLSMILFSPPRSMATAEDGVLYAGETYNLRLNVDLLVLSCCESGLGRLVKGEGLIAMTRGFLYSGARNIVVSLWKVYDKHTNDLMREFYRQLLDGASLPSSLRQAKLKMIKNQTTAFPSKWSGFILVGK